jgi:hypothetical protein
LANRLGAHVRALSFLGVPEVLVPDFDEAIEWLTEWWRQVGGSGDVAFWRSPSTVL